MKYKLIIDNNAEEEIIAIVHAPSSLTQQMENMVCNFFNDWLEWGVTPILVFSGIFVFGYLFIWAIIYSITKRKTDNLNRILKEKQQSAER